MNSGLRHGATAVDRGYQQGTATLRKRSFMGLVIDGIASHLSLAVRAIIASIVVTIIFEWVGMTLFWPELGVDHAQHMLDTELTYLSEEFSDNVFESHWVGMPLDFAERAYDWIFLKSGLDNLLGAAASQTSFFAYIQVVPLMAQVFLLRLMVLLFSFPAFLLFAVVGASTGLTLRDIRRWSGGREFGRVHHRAKHMLPWVLGFSWMVYLTWPSSVHPNAIILPCALILGINVAIATATYKKYL